MSREWHEHKYCSAENLWCWIDEQAQQLEHKVEAAKEAATDSYKLLLMGRREMLDWLADWLHENETTLGEVAKTWGLGEKEEG
jgi:hypothetical protein